LSLLAPFDRPLLLPRLGVGCWRAFSPTTPPLPGTPALLRPPFDRRTDRQVAHFLTYALLADVRGVSDLVPELEASVEESVQVWSPSLCTHSRTELVAALLEGDDAITDATVSVVGDAAIGAHVLVEWHLQGTFDNVGILNDDLLIEPSGGLVESTGVLVMMFHGGRAAHIRCYYDGLGLLEQVVGPAAESPTVTDAT
jgi:hypothetical protein